MSPLKRIRLRSHEGENEGEPDRCVLESVRWAIVDINSSSHAGEQIDACSKTERAVNDC